MSKENQIKILQLNVNGYLKSIENCLNTITQRKEDKELPDVLFLSEFPYNEYAQLIGNNKLMSFSPNGELIRCENSDKVEYDLKPINGNNFKGFKLVSILAIRKRNDIDFIPQKNDIISLWARYYQGILKIKVDKGDSAQEEKELNVFFAHMPQCWPIKAYGVNYNQTRVENKAEMIFAAYKFLMENNNENTFIGGDLNVDLNDNKARCRNIFKGLCENMNDTVYADDNSNHSEVDFSTWRDKRLDYALVSKNLAGKCRTEYIDKTGSDHKALLTTIDI